MINNLDIVDQKKLKKLIEKCRDFNVFPMFLPQYFCNTKSEPVSNLLHEIVDAVLEYLKLMSKEEIDALVNGFPPALKSMIEVNSPEGPGLERVALYYIMAEIHKKYFSLKRVIDGKTDKSKVLEIYPELKERFDKNGLLYLDDRFQLLDSGIIYKDHFLHYHQLLRRGYGSNPNFSFLNKFIKYYSETHLTNQFRIAIDHYRIMPKEFYARIIELDTWYGANFNKEKIDDPNEIGLTVVKRNKDSLFELENHLDRTEFYWSYSKGIKTFEIEEISSSNEIFEQQYYLNKYVHSERDIRKKMLRHFDGAVKVYLKDSYKQRVESKMPNKYKSFKKIKLFRIDGNINIDVWIDLISFFYKSNEMIIEYFDPEGFKEKFSERERDFKAWNEKQSNKP